MRTEILALCQGLGRILGAYGLRAKGLRVFGHNSLKSWEGLKSGINMLSECIPHTNEVSPDRGGGTLE